MRVEHRYYYPDIVVVCDSPKFGDDKPASLLNPKVIIEVTFDTTGLRDWTKKRKHCQRIASLSQYVIVNCPEPSVAIWTRTDEGRWSGPEETDDGEVEIAGVMLGLPDIYEGVAALAAELGYRFED